MDDLDWVGELGPPSLEYYFAGDSRSQNRTFIDFSVRKAVHTDFKKIADAGWTSQISLNNKYQFNADILGGRTIIDSSVAALFYSDKYAQYFYSVSADDAKDNRAEYSAKGGYAGIKVSFGGTWRRENIWLGLFTRYTYLKIHPLTIVTNEIKCKPINRVISILYIYGKIKYSQYNPIKNQIEMDEN